MILNHSRCARGEHCASGRADVAFKISGVPIVDRDGRLVGILTNRDLQFQRDLDRPLRDVMTSTDLINRAGRHDPRRG